jgi:hypothetical protein
VRGNPHAAFDVAGAGNVAWSRRCDTRRRKGETTGNTNFDLNRRASPRPYLGAPGGEIPPGDSTIASIRCAEKSGRIKISGHCPGRARDGSVAIDPGCVKTSCFK